MAQIMTLDDSNYTSDDETEQTDLTTEEEPIALASGLVLAWYAEKFTSGSKTWTDSVAGKNITFSAAASTDENGISQSRTSSNYWQTESLSSIGLGTAKTIEWYGYINSSCYSSSTPGMIIGASQTVNGWSGIGVWAQSSSSYGLQLNIVSTSRILVNSKITSTGFHHILLVCSDSTCTYYVDSDEAIGVGSATNTAVSMGYTYLYNGEGSGRFDGSINRIRVWNRALNSNEVTAVMGNKDTGVRMKIDGNWETALSCYKKINGEWVEKSNLELLIDNKIENNSLASPAILNE